MKYTKPAGAVADLRELEYISALHQTSDTLRHDGSIRTEDIAKFLLSRYGICATNEELSETIARGFSGGGVSEEDGDTLDLCEVTAMLLVPLLRKAEMSLHRDLLEQMRIRNYGHGNNDNDDFEENKSNTDTASMQKLHAIKAGGDNLWNTPNNPNNNNNESEDAAANNTKGRSLRGEDRWPDCDIIGFVLSMILRDVTGDSDEQSTSPNNKPIMTKELLQKIFAFYGEHEISEDERLLEEMLAVAKHAKHTKKTASFNFNTTSNEDEEYDEDEHGHPIILDEITFAHCLTQDVTAYNIATEDRLSTAVRDVFSEMQHGTDVPKEDLCSPKKVFTFPAIDYAVDTFRSKAFVILLWVIWALAFLLWFDNGAIGGDIKCEEKEHQGQAFGCKIGQGIINWLLIMCQLILVGSGSVILCSAGQSDAKSNPLIILFSMGCICVMTFVPVFVQFKVGESQDDDYAFIDTTEQDDEWLIAADAFLRGIIVACGIILILLSIQNLMDRTIPLRFRVKYKWLGSALSSGTARMERNMKQAAAFKVNRMVRNAVAIHKSAEFEHGAGRGSSSSKDSSYGRALLAYTKLQDVKEEIGGWLWCWRRIWSGALFNEDGIWLNNRMLQGNVAQIIICATLVPYFASVIRWINEFYRGIVMVILQELELDDIIPERWRIITPIAIAVFLSMFNAITLSFKYLPSSVRTILEFRYGTIGSLHDGDFLSLRRDVDGASFIFPAMFWGTIASSIFIFFSSLVFWGLIFTNFFFPTFLSIMSAMIGAFITILLKSLFLMLARKYSHERAYYRTRPAVANVVGVILEAWNLGITTLYILKRLAVLIVCAFIFIGRIDIPFLSEEADEIGPARLDNFPVVFRKDLLMHDAHRHPYLERIGLMYIIKLRYRDHFGREAGTSWRLLFVFALFPWLRQFRIRSSDNLQFDTVKFSKDDAHFQHFTEAAAKGKKFGRFGDNRDAGDEIEIHMKSLKDELRYLKDENNNLKDANNQLKEENLKLKQIAG